MDDTMAAEGGVPIGTASYAEWLQQVANKHDVLHWRELTVTQRKNSLYYLYDPQDTNKFEEAVQYVINEYPKSPIEDLKGDVSLLTALSTPLAVTVVRSHCSDTFSLKHVPGLMQKGICPQKLEKILKASHGVSVRRGECSGIFETTRNRNGGSSRRKMSNTMSTMPGQIQCDGQPQSLELSLRLQSLQAQVVLNTCDTQEFLDFVLREEFRNEMGSRLDIYCQRMLSLCGSCVNLNNCHTQHGNILHAAAKYGLAESAKEALAQGYYNMLLELDDDKPNTWPLYYAVENKQWSTIKIFLETLNFSQRQSQIRTMVEVIDCEKVIKEMSDYHKPWWVINAFHHEDLQKGVERKGKMLLMKTVLDTAVQGSEVDPSLLLICNREERKSCITKVNSTNQTDSGSPNAPGTSLFKLMCDCNVEELKCHPSFAALVQHKWLRRYVYIHGMLSLFYVVYLVFLTVALVLAAKSSDPRQYNDGKDYLRLFLEITIFLYIVTVISIDSTLLLVDIHTHYKTKERNFLFDKVSPYACFEFVRYLSTLLIIPLRIADSSFQWQVVSLAIILSGLRLFRYATVLPFMGQYVGTLFLMVKKDLPLLFLVFAVINFSFGSGLYFSLLGYYDNENVDIVNDNSTSEVYLLWMTGARMVTEGSVLTYTGRGGFNFSGRLIYWLFVFCVSVAFLAILIAQFESSYKHLAKRAHLNVVLNKAEIMQKMDKVFSICVWLLKHVPYLKTIQCTIKEDNCDRIRRQVLVDPDNLDPKDYVVGKLSRKLAENDKRVQMLEGKLDKMHELLLSLTKDTLHSAC